MMENMGLIISVIGAVIGGLLIYMLGQLISEKLFKQKSSKRVKDLMGVKDLKKPKVKPTDFGSEEFKIRLAFQKYGMDVYKRELVAANIGRLVLGLVLVSVLRFVFLFPLATSMVGFVCALLVFNSLIEQSWKKLRNEIEKEIPIFLSGFTSTIQVNPNVLQAVEEEAAVLAIDSSLKRWLIDRFVRLGQDKGVAALDELTEEAFRVSNSLGIMIFLIGRLWKTGGMEWKRSFALAASNLEGVMEARMFGIAAGSAAKNSVLAIAMVTGALILVMARNPLLSKSLDNPVVQIVYAIAIIMMVFGYGFMDDMVDNKF
jgi:hypothetical protein